METALGAANWLLSKVLNKLSDDLVAGYVASRELGLNFDKIKTELKYTLGLLHGAQGRDFSHNPGLQGLLEDLSKKADEAEDALDELHYFMIQDELDGTREATPDLGDGLGAQALHARHAARNTAGNWLSCFSVCCRSQDAAAAAAAGTGNTSKAVASFNDIDSGYADKLIFDRVAMSNKIKQLIEDIHSLCPPISKLLEINNSSKIPPKSMERPAIGSTIRQEEFYGRSTIFKQTVDRMTSGTCSDETLSVLPIVGPGGIGKTTFTQHLYNNERTEKHFAVRIWVCVSTNFDVLKLTKEIRSCIPAVENEGETDNLDQLQKSIAKRLKSKRFLIVLDDIWQCSEDRWVNFLASFTMREAEKGSMVIVTTRFPYIAQMVKTTTPVNLEGLEPAEFWVFFQACVFGEVIAEHDNKEELIDIARQIANKLKCSPLAAKTVGRLLKKRFSREHWMGILQKKEWLNQTHNDDIMPALKISYDYLPFHLQKCFSYCGLFPEDYEFDSLEISRFWISIGIIDSCGQNDKIEDIGSKYLDELLDNGFLMKGDQNYYVMHDLMHELAQVVSSKECAYISCSSFRADDVQPSIRHLSILMSDDYNETFGEEMDKLKRRVDIGNLRSLMIFGGYETASLVNILKETFKEIKGLRVLFIFMNYTNSLPPSFSKLIHLRHLKLESPYYNRELCCPRIVSRFYHLKFLDLQKWRGMCDLPKDISRLVNLCHFVAREGFHTNIPEVGKMRLLEELKGFHVKKESARFELRELGQLVQLGGELSIRGLENVRSSKEAAEARLMAKRDLIKLGLFWSRGHQSKVDDILTNLQPHSNLRALCIVNHGGPAGPSWLCSNIHMKYLETLHLEGVSWSTLPPFGQIYHLRKLKLKNIVGICQFGPDFIGGITEKSFTHLKEVQLHHMPELVEWIGGGNTHLFSRLERITCSYCPKLTALPFSRCSSSSTQDNTIWFPNLCYLSTQECPKLSLPPLPHTRMLSSFRTDSLRYEERGLCIYKMPGELAFHNLGEVERLMIFDASLISFTDLQKLHPLRSIDVRSCEDTFLRGLDDDIVLYSVQSLDLSEFIVTRKSLSNLFKCFPALSYLSVGASSEHHDEVVVLQVPPSSSLRHVRLDGCKNLILPMEDGGGFQSLLSLKSVSIQGCNMLLSRWSTGEAAQGISPFPPHVEELSLWHEPSTLSMALFSNLTSLTELELRDCKNFTMDGFNPLITSTLDSLMVCNSRFDETDPYSIAADLLAEVARTKTMHAGSFHLVRLEVDSISAVLVAPICTRISATLRKLAFVRDWRVESFTEEQEQALQFLTSLQWLQFDRCRGLLSIPRGLHCLSSLETIIISGSPRIRSLPKKGLPDSLQMLRINESDCSAELYEECQKLRGTRPDIDVDFL
ncbi:hypothetical protein SETIT_1G010400v2 [Setaria italica]|uniref:Uncharacterized protein n=1 Tax=Setaria italica TaxID=4555 RepID=K3Z113_SETIT|nr:disease resistance protein RGA2 [Setaria italica]XP_004951261.1 disease resistance protein RGA2 [Setaria italica]XP_012703022.1 disease resistance protein RGA2 [Setaria italica]RCV04564.1 hypothetical protein SETIT_1G010400v2 [Setaria italica]